MIRCFCITMRNVLSMCSMKLVASTRAVRRESSVGPGILVRYVWRPSLLRYGIFIIKIRRSRDRLIFIMGILILICMKIVYGTVMRWSYIYDRNPYTDKTAFYIVTAPIHQLQHFISLLRWQNVHGLHVNIYWYLEIVECYRIVKIRCF